jgi:hypothetical protein
MGALATTKGPQVSWLTTSPAARSSNTPTEGVGEQHDIKWAGTVQLGQPDKTCINASSVCHKLNKSVNLRWESLPHSWFIKVGATQGG